MQVSPIKNGDYVKVKGIDFGDGAKSFDARAASAAGGGAIELRLDSQTGTLVGTCSVGSTGGLTSWATKSCSISGATGKHDLFLKFTGGSGNLFYFNWWKFTPLGTETSFGKVPECGNRIEMAVITGNAPSIRLDFSQPVLPRTVKVCLFDLTGRMVTTLFTGRVTSSHLTLPMKGAEIRPGAYSLRVLLDGKTVLTEKLTLK
jgi:hypothetical protein